MRTLLPAALLLAGLAACGGQELNAGEGDSLFVHGAQWVRGELPGSPPEEESPSGLPAITAFDLTNPVVLPGQAGKSFQGRATDSAASVALQLDGQGEGFWVLPAAAPDPQYPGELTWSARADFLADLPPGLRRLRVVALDEKGRAGRQAFQTLCIASQVPDNGRACEPSAALPEAVVVLRWNVDADLDLGVVTPEGRRLTPANPLLVAAEPGQRPPADASGINRDSLARCEPDGLRQEDMVFQQRPAKGSRFELLVHPTDACGQRAAAFEMTVWEARGEGADRKLVRTFAQSGLLSDLDIAGGGLHVATYRF